MRYWQSPCKSVLLVNGDMLDVKLPCRYDSLITDPPYMAYKTGRYDASAHHRPIGYFCPSVWMPYIVPQSFDVASYLVWCRWDSFSEIATAATSCKLLVKNCIVWAKSNHTSGDLTGNFAFKHEMAVFAVRGKWKLVAGKRDSNLWNESVLFSKAKRIHPTQKPEPLMERSVLNCCKEGGVVYDPFMGSGTTGIACVRHNRVFIGVEKDSQYFDSAVDRIKKELA